jgi:hypothetical protein
MSSMQTFVKSGHVEEKISLGISSCLLGQKVRYDGGHRLDHYLVETLGRFVEWVPVCPEVGSGLPVPRKHLTRDEKAELTEVIADYHRGFIPLMVPIVLIRHYVRKYEVIYLKRQLYINPHPVELMLRNHV